MARCSLFQNELQWSYKIENTVVFNGFRKRLDGSELDGSEHFEKSCQNVSGAAVGGAAGADAASAVCIYYALQGGASCTRIST